MEEPERVSLARGQDLEERACKAAKKMRERRGKGGE